MAIQKPFRNCYLSTTNKKLNISPYSESPMMLHAPSLARVVLNRPDVHQEIVSNYMKYSNNYWTNVYVRQRAYLEKQRKEKLDFRTKEIPANEKSIQTYKSFETPPKQENSLDLEKSYKPQNVILTHVPKKSVWRDLWCCFK